MKRIMSFPIALVISVILIFTIVSCGSEDETTLTINQSHTEILSVLVVADTISNIMALLSAMPFADATIPCGDTGSVTIEPIGTTKVIMTWNDCKNDAVKPDIMSGKIIRDVTDADSSGVAESMMVTVTEDFKLEADYDDDGNLDTEIIWTAGTTLDHQGFQGNDIIDSNSDAKVDVIIDGCADSVIFGNKSRMTYTDFDLFSNQQDPGLGFFTEFSLNGNVRYKDDCVSNLMKVSTTKNLKMLAGNSVNEGRISVNSEESLLDITDVDAWSFTVDGLSQDYTQAEFQQLPATCP